MLQTLNSLPHMQTFGGIQELQRGVASSCSGSGHIFSFAAGIICLVSPVRRQLFVCRLMVFTSPWCTLKLFFLNHFLIGLFLVFTTSAPYYVFSVWPSSSAPEGFAVRSNFFLITQESSAINKVPICASTCPPVCLSVFYQYEILLHMF